MRRVLASDGLFCETDEEANAALEVGARLRHERGLDDTIAAIVWELSPRVSPFARLPREVADAARRIPLVVRADLSEGSVSEIVRLSGIAGSLWLSIPGVSELDQELRAALADPQEPTADQTIIRGVAPHVHKLARSIVVIGTTAGRARTTVADFAALCHCSPGTLAYRLRFAGGLSTSDLLGWMTALHTAWRRGVLGWSCKHTAHAARYETTAALNNYVRRRVGLRLSDLSDPADFSLLLTRFARRLSIPELSPVNDDPGRPTRPLTTVALR